jgi:hypothetical protein
LPDWLAFYHDLDEEDRLDYRLQFDMQKEMEERFDLDPNSAIDRDFYDALLLFLGNSISSKTKEYRSAYIFNQNLKISAVISLLFFGYEIFNSYPDPLWGLFGLSALIVVGSTFSITRFLIASPHVYVEMLEKEFYMKTLREPMAEK